MNMDMEFDNADFRNVLDNSNVNLNCASAKEHVPMIERRIRTLKERCRARMSRLPHKKMPAVMIRGMVADSTTWLNAFPPKGGVSKIYSPRMIVGGTKIDFNKHCRIEFGQYAQVTEEPDPSNTMNERTTGAIALGCAGNTQGS